MKQHPTVVKLLKKGNWFRWFQDLPPLKIVALDMHLKEGYNCDFNWNQSTIKNYATTCVSKEFM